MLAPTAGGQRSVLLRLSLLFFGCRGLDASDTDRSVRPSPELGRVDQVSPNWLLQGEGLLALGAARSTGELR